MSGHGVEHTAQWCTAPAGAAALSPPARGPRYVAGLDRAARDDAARLWTDGGRLLSNPAAHSYDAPTGLGDRSAFPLRVACTVVAAGMAAGRLAAHRGQQESSCWEWSTLKSSM